MHCHLIHFIDEEAAGKASQAPQEVTEWELKPRLLGSKSPALDLRVTEPCIWEVWEIYRETEDSHPGEFGWQGLYNGSQSEELREKSQWTTTEVSLKLGNYWTSTVIEIVNNN